MNQENSIIEAYWKTYLSTLAEGEQDQHYFEAESWGNSPELADRICALIASGTKTSTSSLLWAQQHYQWLIEKPGDKSMVLNSAKKPVCIIETVRVDIKAFNEVDEEFVYNYGEGDRTMNFWNVNMWEYYVQECAQIGKSAERTMPMICPSFKLIYKA